MSIFWNGSAINTLMWNGVETTGVYNGNIVWGNSTQQAKTLTLYHSEGGSLTADTLTGYPGDSVNLTTAYNTYWRFSGYDVTGDGTLNGNTYTFGNTDTTICACYKVNAFTATGTFEKGSNVSTGISGSNSWNYNLRQYAIRNASTGDIPAIWYSTSNRWNPSDASAYLINLNPKMGFTASFDNIRGNANYNTTKINCGTYTNSTISNTQTFTGGNASTQNTTSSFNYSKSFTTTTQGTCSISARMNITLTKGASNKGVRLGYIANATTGTWTATGYAP